jgi:hypothetical protein
VTAAPPYWVKLTREGNTITAYASADGVTWDLFSDTSPDGAHTNPIDVEMADPVLIGLFVTSHAAGEKRTYEFSDVDIVGDITADTMNTDIGIPGNAPAPIYVALEDTTGAMAKITHGNPAATNIESARQWTIPLDKFAGVDTSSAAKLYIGVGDGQPGGTGSITVSDVQVVLPAGGGANIIWVTGGYDDKPDGVTDDIEWVDILKAEGYTVDNSESYVELDDAKIAALEAADLIIVSRNSNSGDYDDGDEIAQWNAITTPIINSSTHIVRSSRWKWVDSTSILSLTPTMVLADGTEIPGINADVGPASFIDAAAGNGTITATGDGLPFIIEWEAGVEFYDGAGEIAGGPRVFFAAGTQETSPDVGRGEMNLTPEALAVFLDTVKKLIPAAAKDITVPGDIVKGVPDDGDWPGAEAPPRAIDDIVRQGGASSKYLHFKGGSMATGIRITPLDGPSLVTGLTFTTANDVPTRDPITFELSGSNVSIDGPYELIAAGDIVDFAGADDWPRYTMNATPITFANKKLYAHYQIVFPTLRGETEGLMQIAEIELLGVLAADAPASIAWVSYHAADDEPHADAAAFDFTQAPDIGYTDLLKANGYKVMRVLTSGTPDVELLNTMDLVIISRTASSGHYSGGGASLWNSVTAPMINLNGYTLRNSRLGFTDGGTMVDTTGDVKLAVTDPTHPIFAGIALTDGVMDNFYAEGAVPLTTDVSILSRGVSINNNNLDEEGTVLATIAEVSADTGPVGGIVIAEIPAGATLQNSSGSPDDVLGGPRLIFLTGSREPSGVTGGQAAALYDLFPDGETMFLNAVDYMINPIEPADDNLLANGGFEDGVVDPWSTYGDASIEVVQDDPVEGDNCLHVTVGSAGANFWDAGLQHAGHVFEPGKSYTLSAYLKAKEGTMDINFKPELGADPWTGYGSQAFTMTDTWAEYTINTGVIPEVVDPATITFHIAYTAGEFYVDDVRFTED